MKIFIVPAIAATVLFLTYRGHGNGEQTGERGRNPRCSVSQPTPDTDQGDNEPQDEASMAGDLLMKEPAISKAPNKTDKRH